MSGLECIDGVDVQDVSDPDDPRLDDFRDLNSVDRRPDLPTGKGLVIADVLNIHAVNTVQVAHGPSSTKASIRSAALRSESRWSLSSVASRLVNHS